MRTTTSAATGPERRFHLERRAVLLASLFLTAACSGSQVATESAYSQIKPKARAARKTSSRLGKRTISSFRVDNVADGRTSYKNYVKLFVNGREVATPPGHDNLSATYYYSMRLQEGVYEVHAEYHAVGAWRKRVFDVVADDPVTILPNQRTLLEARLEKDDRGMLARSPAHFRSRYVQMTPPPRPRSRRTDTEAR
jgi:hypothetical protein